MRFKKYLYALLIATTFASTPATMVAHAATGTSSVLDKVTDADKILTYSVPENYAGLTVTIKLEEEGKFTAKVVNDGNTFACTQIDDTTLTCTATDIKRGTLEILITNKDGSGKVPKVTATMKMASSSTSNSTDNISVGTDITDLKLYFRDNSLVGEWADTGIGQVNVQVVDLNSSETIANTQVDTNNFEIEIPSGTAQIVVNVVPSASSSVDGASNTYTLDVPTSPRAEVQFENATATNKSDVTATAKFSDSYAVKAFCNDSLVMTEDYKGAGEYELEVPLTDDGENNIVLYVIDQTGNMFSFNKTITLDTKGPLITFDKNYDKITVGNTQFQISGKIEDYKDFTINDKPILVSTDGTFSYDLSLHTGDNEFKLVAHDEAGNESAYNFTITYDENAGKVNPFKVGGAVVVLGAIIAFIIRKKKKGGAVEKSEKKSAKVEEKSADKLSLKEKLSSLTSSKEEKSSGVPTKIKKEHIRFACAIIAVIYIFGIAMSFSYITSDSMSPTLMTGDIAVYNKFAYKVRPIERGDIISFKLSGGSTTYSKRVIALAGDKVEFSNGDVYINGELLDESAYLNEDVETNCNKSFDVPAGCCFVLGDNRENSKDSRYFENPYIPYKNVVDRLMFDIPTHSIFGK